jgi:hypothetical protein
MENPVLTRHQTAKLKGTFVQIVAPARANRFRNIKLEGLAAEFPLFA